MKDFVYLVAGETFETPIFNTVALKFEGVTPALDEESRGALLFEDAGITFTNEDGDELSLELFQSNSTDILLADDFVLNANDSILEGEYFFLNEDNSGINTTIAYKVNNIDSNDADADGYVEFLRLADGSKFTIDQEDLVTSDKELDDTGVFLTAFDSSLGIEL